MNFENLGAIVAFDPSSIQFPDDVISALPEDCRLDVDVALETMNRLDAITIPYPITAHELARSFAVAIEQSAIKREDFDWEVNAAAAVANADANTVAFHAHKLAISYARSTAISKIYSAIPAAMSQWSQRVAQIGVEVDVLIDQGVVLDELEARRGSKADADKWVKLSGLLTEFDGIRSAFTAARYLVDRSDQDDRFALSSVFTERVDSDRRMFASEALTGEHPLVTGLRLGWKPWCPTRGEQAEMQQRVVEERRDSSPRIPQSVLIN